MLPFVCTFRENLKSHVLRFKAFFDDNLLLDLDNLSNDNISEIIEDHGMEKKGKFSIFLYVQTKISEVKKFKFDRGNFIQFYIVDYVHSQKIISNSITFIFIIASKGWYFISNNCISTICFILEVILVLC